MSTNGLRAWGAVGAVAVGSFTLVTNEFLPVGVLPALARDLDVSIGTAGTTMTVPGAVAAVAAPVLAVAAGRVDRRVFLVLMSVVFIAADVVAATSTAFVVMIIARCVLGLGIGGFWAIAGTLGARLIRGEGGVRANAVIFAGVSIASVIGVPAGALIGASFGWRAAFLATACLGAVALIGQLGLLPRLGVDSPVTWRALGSILRGHNARVGLAVTVLLVVGQNSTYTYLTPFLESRTGLSGHAIGGVLFAYGAAGIIGNFAIGALLRRRLLAWAVVDAGIVAISILFLPLLGGMTPAAVLLLIAWGCAFGAVPVAMQTWVFTADGTSSEGGSALYISAFQISVAGGALLGGVLIDRLGLTPTMVIGGALAGLAAITLATASSPVRRGVPASGRSRADSPGPDQAAPPSPAT